jgi:hypothetical protein
MRNARVEGQSGKTEGRMDERSKTEGESVKRCGTRGRMDGRAGKKVGGRIVENRTDAKERDGGMIQPGTS